MVTAGGRHDGALRVGSERHIDKQCEPGDWPYVAGDSPQHPASALDASSVHLWLLRAERGDPAVRALLARYTGLAPEALAVDIGAHGKPALRGVDLAFNLSHSGAHTLLAVARGCALGVDLEHRRRVRRRSALLERCFGQAEPSAAASRTACGASKSTPPAMRSPCSRWKARPDRRHAGGFTV
jgi:hypothetical protein